jgi:polysaccharide deacetylase family protein (PEP-CTERM system associated)
MMSAIRKVRSQTTNAMTVDVEDYFQVSAFESHIDRVDWESIPSRVEQNIDRILALFDRKEIKATFFTLGWIAERFPVMTRRIVEQGHELASHGWEHIRVTNQDRASFQQDVVRTKSLLEDISGCSIKGYRAASYSIGADNLWALDVLAETGHKYSSSIVPIRHDLYGMPDAPRFPFRVANGDLLEIPVTTVVMGRLNIPCGGGGWFRLYPYAFSKWALNRVNASDQEPAVFYFHPWEIDYNQPRQKGLPLKSRFRHYVNLERMHHRLESLLDDFKWDRMDSVYRQ